MEKESHRERASLERTRELMDKATRDCLVTDYEDLIPSLVLPDPNDRHVLAAAIVGHCDLIITQNLKDFPEDILKPYGIEAQHPDIFLFHQLSLSPVAFCEATQKVRARLKNPPYSVQTYLDTLAKQGLSVTVAKLEQFRDLL